MAIRLTYSILFDGKSIRCCPDRRQELERLGPVIEIGYEMIQVGLQELRACKLCEMLPCLYGVKRGK